MLRGCLALGLLDGVDKVLEWRWPWPSLGLVVIRGNRVWNILSLGLDLWSLSLCLRTLG